MLKQAIKTRERWYEHPDLIRLIDQYHEDLSSEHWKQKFSELWGMGKADRQLTVLIVDDQPQVLEGLHMGLSDLYGYRCLMADAAGAALDTLAREHVDLILLDYPILPPFPVVYQGMRIESDFTLARAIKQASSQTAIIVMSDSFSETIKEQFMDAGVDALLPKPFKFDALHRLIHELN